MILHLGDCLDVLKSMPDNSVDSLVTDPPAGISFMGKAWDSDKGGRDQWIKWMSEVMCECLRVMKPGAHGLVWALPRTSHWTGSALENAGFEVRDIVTHLFGQGFPKSLDISKAIDKAAGIERQVIGPSNRHPGKSKKTDVIGDYARFSNAGDFITAPATDAAKQWAGWHTSLKPAVEMWWLVRKPIAEKNIAANVLKHGCGGINIDGCRIEASIEDQKKTNRLNHKGNFNWSHDDNTAFKMGQGADISKGRFPANLVLSHSPYCDDEHCDLECAVLQLNAQSGPCPGPWGKDGSGNKKGKTSLFKQGGINFQNTIRGQEKATGASRFFYCAKVSPSERGKDNNHPTIKPQKLMRYLCRLITPPNGIVLDPFMGSGSTGMAAQSEGFDFIGIEKDPDYFKIAEARIGLNEGNP
jgi:DNA modification methylase